MWDSISFLILYDFLILSHNWTGFLQLAVHSLLFVATWFPFEMGDSVQPKDFCYYQIWVSEDGETHFIENKMTGFTLQPYSSKPQLVRSDFGGNPTKLVFTELAVGLEQPLHSAPTTQFVVTLSGSWYVKTTDGKKFEFHPGDVLFQDNTKDSPADKQPQHYSGVVGDKPCRQMIVQLDRKPE
ncbi:hypothetical protein O6H91_01G022100 [Diphasiastrum complanatum]|nr:hypothetical protein O6H91_01G022100 [Diphasiastrum complanatum]